MRVDMQLIAGQLTHHGLMRAGHQRILSRVDGSGKTGFELAAVVAALAGNLAERGLRRKRIGLWYSNSIAAVEAFLAVEWLGAVRVAADPALAVDEARKLFLAAGVDRIVADPEHADLLGGDALVHSDATPLEGTALSPGEWVRDEPAVVYPRQITNGELVAVTMSYRNWAASLTTSMRLFMTGAYGAPVSGDDHFLTTQQIIHGTCQIGTFPFIAMGLPQVVLPRFDVATVLRAISDHKVTSVVLISEMVKRISAAEGVDMSPLHRLRRVVYGGAPLGVDELQIAIDAFGPSLHQIYGRMEAGWPLSILRGDELCHDGRLREDRMNSCGRPIAGIEVTVGGHHDGPAEGELCVRADTVVKEFADNDGWCHTGDIVRRDGDGFLFHLGRSDRQINCAGYHIYPEEIEEALMAIPGIRQARVTGEDMPPWGITLVAELVTEDSQASDEEWTQRIRAELGMRLAKFKVPRVVRVLSA